ncbi:MAG: glycogen synthase, partial [Clostridia bacterium]|nr:glycogen synthase [Clostridia bacterium]
MKLLIAASESAPFAATGGLGDVIGSLPAALKSGRKEDDVRVVLPLYGTMDPVWREKLTFVGECRVQLNWRDQYCGLFKLLYKHVTYYFIDNEYYFKRDRLYAEPDDGERFAFFCRAITHVMDLMGFYPDILHANDWQTALSVIYLKRKYGDTEPYSRIRTVFTIHNIQYQGNFDGSIMANVFDLFPSDWQTVEWNGQINLMKGAIVCADRVTTVSPTYAREILSPAFSFGLDGILHRYEWKLSGILNGIDRDYYSPSGEDAKNGEIPAPFHVNRMEGKAVCKQALQRELGLPERPDVPLVAMIGRMVDAKGLDLVTAGAEMLMGDDLQLAVLGTGEPGYEQFFRELAARHPDRCKAVLAFDKHLAKRMYAGADIFLMPSRS